MKIAGFCIFCAIMGITGLFVFALWEVSQAVEALAAFISGAYP